MEAAADKMVPRTVPRAPLPPRPPANKLFCGYQDRIEDLKVHIFDIANGKYGLCGYLGTLSAMKYRQLTWSPLIIRGIPVTPLANPKTGESSFFIIRLIDSSNPRYKVDLLFRDTDLYFVGFRRQVALDSEEKVECNGENGDAKSEKERRRTKKKAGKAVAKGVKAQRKPGWGEWNQFTEKDMKLPSFFNARNSGISSSYLSPATAGGCDTFQEILFVLGTFEDGEIDKERMQKACFSVMVMISEASRLRSVFNEVVLRIVQNWSAQVLCKELTDNVNNWAQMGRQIMRARLNGKMDFMSLPEESFVAKFKGDDHKHKLTKLGDLLDEDIGEVLLIRSKVPLLGYTEDEVGEISNQAKTKHTGGPADRKESDFIHETI